MDFSLTKDQKFFKGQAAKALRQIVLPHADTIDKSDVFPWEIFRELGRLGYYGIRYPVEIGGMGADCISFTILAEELARVSMGLAAAVTMQCLMGTNFLYRFGNKDQKEGCLYPAMRGEKIATIAFTEPDCGSDLGGYKDPCNKRRESLCPKGEETLDYQW